MNQIFSANCMAVDSVPRASRWFVVEESGAVHVVIWRLGLGAANVGRKKEWSPCHNKLRVLEPE